MSRIVPSVQALRALRSLVQPSTHARAHHARCATRRFQHGQATPTQPNAPLRAQSRSEASARNSSEDPHKSDSERLGKWDLFVGIEVHAELSTSSKLFSAAGTPLTSPPNTHTALFDTATPGAQPQFQKEALLPALRAALALGCEIQEKSSWDRKHYFWWDQPQGYQITQYYEPFAKDGRLMLYPWDDIDPVDAENSHGAIIIGIKQVQMEQDTAKTVLQPPETYLLDFNRAGIPLVEIITRPEIRSPKTAAAVVKKIQALLQSVGANSTGMELGGLRADVNVSVRRKDTHGALEYDGIKGLNQRTEIKNLNSFKAIEEAIIAERDRQIDVREAGGRIEGETRGWTLGSTSTRRLRGKEGQVDYRYMPDPDLGPLRIGKELVRHVRETLPLTPTEAFLSLADSGNARLPEQHPLNFPHVISVKDAKTLVSLDDGERLEFYLSTLYHAHILLEDSANADADHRDRTAKAVANWVLMDLPTFLTARDLPFPYMYTFPSSVGQSFDDLDESLVLGTHSLAAIIVKLIQGRITQKSARALLEYCRFPASEELQSKRCSLAENDHNNTIDASDGIERLITFHDLEFIPLSQEQYQELAREVVDGNVDMAQKAADELRKTQGQKKGKLMWFVGQMMRIGETGKVDAKEAERHLVQILGESTDANS